MGLRFRKSVKICKGVKLNFGKTGASLTIGTKGLHYTIHTSGRKTTSVGIPGTGVSYVSTSGDGKRHSSQCETNASNIGSTALPRKKRRTWLWVLGWLFIFPIPLTILILRNQKMNKVVKCAIIALAWILYLIIALSGGSKDSATATQTSGSSAKQTVESSSENIGALSFSKTDDVTVRVGKTCAPEYIKEDVKLQNDFSADDVAFCK